MFAEAKTSAGAPFLICVASVFEPANEYVSFGVDRREDVRERRRRVDGDLRRGLGRRGGRPGEDCEQSEDEE